MKTFERINSVIINIIEKFLIMIGSILTITVLVNVFMRYFFRSTIPWAEELSRFLFIWVTFVGVVIANDRSEHMRLDFIVHMLPEKVRKLVELLAYAISIFLLAMLVQGGIKYSMTQWDWRSSALGVRHGLVYAIAPISLCYMMLQFLSRFISGVQEMLGKDGERS
ncbi:TRAP transporter small permease [Clostridium sp. AN503]|uniref:TRAP transporter small permease n=1 Tax=Clostridium sp. AN503 TaxID=3160598 RepID=UPI0034579BD5